MGELKPSAEDVLRTETVWSFANRTSDPDSSSKPEAFICTCSSRGQKAPGTGEEG